MHVLVHCPAIVKHANHNSLNTLHCIVLSRDNVISITLLCPRCYCVVCYCVVVCPATDLYKTAPHASSCTFIIHTHTCVQSIQTLRASQCVSTSSPTSFVTTLINVNCSVTVVCHPCPPYFATDTASVQCTWPLTAAMTVLIAPMPSRSASRIKPLPAPPFCKISKTQPSAPRSPAIAMRKSLTRKQLLRHDLPRHHSSTSREKARSAWPLARRETHCHLCPA